MDEEERLSFASRAGRPLASLPPLIQSVATTLLDVMTRIYTMPLNTWKRFQESGGMLQIILKIFGVSG